MTTKQELAQKRDEYMSQIEVGDVFVSKWGYDQTNVDFYVVTRKTRCCLYLQKCGQKVHETTGWASENVIPNLSKRVGPERRHMLNPRYGRPAVDLNSYSFATRWNGSPVYQSHYA